MIWTIIFVVGRIVLQFADAHEFIVPQRNGVRDQPGLLQRVHDVLQEVMSAGTFGWRRSRCVLQKI